MEKQILDLMTFVKNSTTAFHAVQNGIAHLEKHGFQEINPTEKWDLSAGGKYYITKNDSSLIAFILGEDTLHHGFRIIASHSDSPSLRLKPSCEVKQNGYVKLNVEVYGGPILDTWFDRPLSIAGRVMLKGIDAFHPEMRLVDLKEPIAIIPNLAIHLQRGKDKDAFSKQKDLQAIIAEDEAYTVKNHVAKLLAVSEDDILDYDLFLYECTEPQLVGEKKSWISAPRLDNLAMAHASLEAISNTQNHAWTSLCVIFDNEEVGNRTKQGAASPWLRYIMERIMLQASQGREDYFIALEHSFLLSADLAHAVHPNRPEKHDPVNQPKLNQGPVIKISANQSYTSDSDSISVFEEICKNKNIPTQKFVNHSDQPGGSTIGPTNTSQIPIRAIDIGNPCLAMHAIREITGVSDHVFMIEAMKGFYESK